MPRRPRVVIPEVPHHVTQRGNNREQVFLGPANYRAYLDLLARHAVRHGLSILGYCLMPNHVHLIAAPRSDRSLARALGCTHSEYALAVNREERRSGHLWQNRYFSCPMDGAHLLQALRYVELNPVRARLAVNAWDWPWSSARSHTVDSAMDSVLDYRWAGYFDAWDYAEWKEMLSARTAEGEEEAIRRATRTGEPLGSRNFLTDLERRAGRRLKVLDRGRPKKLPKGDESGNQTLLFD